MKIRIKNNNLYQLNPVKKYKIPKYPVYALARENLELLKKLPSRWQKSKKVISCLSAVGLLSLSGCFPVIINNNPCSRCGFSHFGGSGGSPIYVIYLTEQEAINLIRTKAETAGLNLNSTPPDNTVNVWWMNIGLDLYDEEKNVAMTLIDLNKSGWQRCNVGYNKDIAEEARIEFANQKNDITIGVFHNPDKPFGRTEPDAAAIAEAEERFKEQLTAQVQEFIESLQAQGIIQ